MKKTKLALIDATFKLLYKKGYCATGLTEILNIVEMTKGAMYYHFTSKHALVLATIEHYLESLLENHWIEPFEGSDKPLDVLIGQITAYKDMFTEEEHYLDIKHGCPLNNFILDMSDKDEAFFKYLESVYSRWQESLEKALTKAQTLKQTKTDFDAKKQALYIISSLEGSIASAKAYNNIDVLSDNVTILSNYIKNL